MPRYTISNNPRRYGSGFRSARHYRHRGNPVIGLIMLIVGGLYVAYQRYKPTGPSQPLFPEVQTAWAQFLSRLNTLTPTQWAFIGGALFIILVGLIGMLVVLSWAGQKPDAERQAWEEAQRNQTGE